MPLGVQIKTVGFETYRDLANSKTITPALYDVLSNAWASGAESFVRTAVREILVETGMSAASLFPLARAIKNGATVKTIENHINNNIKRQSRKTAPTFPSGRRSSGPQNRAAGRKAGQKAFRLNFGSVNRPVFQFSYTIVVFQWALWEQRGRSNALQDGLVAFQDTIRIRFIRDAKLLIREWLKRRGKLPRGDLGRLVDVGTDTQRFVNRPVT